MLHRPPRGHLILVAGGTALRANDASRMDQNNSKAPVANEHLGRAIPVPSGFFSDAVVGEALVRSIRPVSLV